MPEYITNGVVTQADSISVTFRATSFSATVATITSAVGVQATDRMSLAGEWSFSMPMEDYDKTTMATGKFAAGTATYTSEGVSFALFSGQIQEIDDSFDPNGRMVRISGVNMLAELGNTQIQSGEIYTPLMVTAAKVAGVAFKLRELTNANGELYKTAGYTFPEATDDDAGTSANIKMYSFYADQGIMTDVQLETGLQFLYVGNEAPFEKAEFDIDTGSIYLQDTVASVKIQAYTPDQGWLWQDDVDVTNTTIVSGKPFKQDGAITWVKNELEAPLTTHDLNGYWMRFFVYDTPGGIQEIDRFYITAVRVQVAGPNEDDVSDLVTDYAPAGWNLALGSETGTANGGTAIAIAGETLLQLLVDLAKRTGENFALIGVSQVKWFATPPSSGITAKEAPESGDTSTSCYITKMTRRRERRNIVTRVSLYGAGNDPESTVTLRGLEGADGGVTVPGGFSVDKTNNWLVNTTLEATLGATFAQTVRLPNIGAMRGGTGPNRQAAAELLKAGIAFLNANAAESEHYNATLTGLRSTALHPGMTMVVNANVRNANGTVLEAINETLVAVEITKSLDINGNLTHDVVFGKYAEHVPDSRYLQTAELLKTFQKDNHFQPSAANRIVGNFSGSTGVSGGAEGGSGGGTTAALDTHIAETTTAHQIPLQIDNKIATHAAIDDAHHDPVTVTAPITLSGQLVGIATQSPITTSGGILGVGVTGGLEISGANVRVKAGDGITVATGSVAVVAGNGLGFSAGSLIVNAGDGLEIVTDNLVVKLSVLSALEFVGGELRVARGGGLDLVGGGLLALDPSTLTAVTTNGTSGTGHTHAITATADAHALVSSLLKADASGHIKLRSITIQDNASIGQDLAITRDITTVRHITTTGDISVGNDLTVTNDVDVLGNTTTATLNSTGNADLYGSTLRVRNGRVGVNREPDSQFDVDVNNALRARWLIGPHALQVPDVSMILNFDRSLTGHRGQVPSTQGGSILYSKGKFSEGVVAYPSLTNLCLNPSFETDTTGWASYSLGTVTRSAVAAYRGGWSLFCESGGGQTVVHAAYLGGIGTIDTAAQYSARFAVLNKNVPTTGTVYLVVRWDGGLNGPAAAYHDLGVIGGAGKWREFTDIAFQADFADRTSVLLYPYVTGVTADGQGFYLDGVTIVKQAYSPPIFDGTMPGCAWTGTAHASNSTYAEPSLVYKALPVSMPGSERAAQADILNDVEGSVLCWVNMAAVTSSNNRYLVYLENDDNTVAVAFYISTTGKVVAVVNTVTLTGATTITAGGWILVGMDYSVAGGVRVFLNGVLDASGSYTAPSFKQDATFRLLSGPTGFSDNSPLTGMADGAVFVARQLEEIEHRAIYESNAPVFSFVSVVPSGGVTAAGGSYSLDDGGLKVFDEDGNLVGRTEMDTGKALINYDVEELRVAGSVVLLDDEGISIAAVDAGDPINPENTIKFVDGIGSLDILGKIEYEGYTMRLNSTPLAGSGAAVELFTDSPTGDTAKINLLAAAYPSVTISGTGTNGGQLMFADMTLLRFVGDALKWTGGALTYKNAAGNAITVGDSLADDAWVTPTLSNSWVNYGSSKSTCQYRMTTRGTVALKGVVKSGSSATATIFTLPVGYRPSETRRFVAAANSAVGIVEVTTAGVVSFALNGSTTQSSLDGIEIWL